MKTWIKTNFYKISSILSLFLATTGLIVCSIAQHKTNKLSYYLDYDYEAHCGGYYFWATQVSNEHKILLYFKEKPKNEDDIKWNGIYPKRYFNN